MGLMRIKIRRAKIADVPAICTLSQSLFEHERQFTDEYNMEWSHGKDGKQFFTKSLKSRASFILLAEYEKKVIGYILIKLEHVSWRVYNPLADVTNLSVDPMYRGQGVGTKLFEHAKSIAKKRGVRRLNVQALAGNLRALKFYKTMGFEDFSVTLLMNIDE